MATQEIDGYSIGVVARLTGVKPHTLRVWEKRYGLFDSAARVSSQRRYTNSQVEHIRLLKKLLDKGLRIGQIAAMSTAGLKAELGATFMEKNQKGDLQQLGVIGKSLISSIDSFNKQHPDFRFLPCPLSLECLMERQRGEEFLDQVAGMVFYFPTITTDHIAALMGLAKRKFVLVCFDYCSLKHKTQLESNGVVLKQRATSLLAAESELFSWFSIHQEVSRMITIGIGNDLQIPTLHSPIFDEQGLVEAEQRGGELNCECPSHLVAIIRQLQAFESYSRACEVDSKSDAATHALIYYQANQAKHVLERALYTVLNEKKVEVVKNTG